MVDENSGPRNQDRLCQPRAKVPRYPHPSFSPVYVVTEAGSHSRLIDSCITQIKAQEPSRTCNESKEKEEDYLRRFGEPGIVSRQG